MVLGPAVVEGLGLVLVLVLMDDGLRGSNAEVVWGRGAPRRNENPSPSRCARHLSPLFVGRGNGWLEGRFAFHDGASSTAAFPRPACGERWLGRSPRRRGVFAPSASWFDRLTMRLTRGMRFLHDPHPEV
ncbi:hypothetical protein GA830_14405 [Mesorhizobium sp. NBSH29]|nr:hypothetical protein GA830_14405 [Mesorhizobium sp. NBSH29]